MPNRRNFLKLASLGALAPTFPISAASPSRQEFSVFTKHLIGLDFDNLADLIAELGIDGIEAPVRPKGHVEPERVEEDLPKLAEALKQRGLKINLITSGINEVSSGQHTEKVLRTAKALGVPAYRMNYRKYDLTQPIYPQLEGWREKCDELVALSHEIGIRPLYQNHSGRDYLGAPVWDVYELMRSHPPEQWGFAFDIYHATIEGGMSWPLELNLVRDRIGSAYFKNFKWEGTKAKACPLGEGVVQADYVKALKKLGYQGPVSLHVEYLEGDPKNADYLKEAMMATKRDLALLREWWQA
jgi:sugar phosphate isomerase/epimerase